MQRALAVGVVNEDTSNPWVPRNLHALFASERDRALFKLRQELLKGHSSPERAKQLMTQIEELRAEQAAIWLAGS